jgi:hypothetical protein
LEDRQRRTHRRIGSAANLKISPDGKLLHVFEIAAGNGGFQTRGHVGLLKPIEHQLRRQKYGGRVWRDPRSYLF